METIINKPIFTSLKESHNRKVQSDIDICRSEINKLNQDKNKLSPKKQNLQWELDQILMEERRIDIIVGAREREIAVLSDKFWK